MKRYKAKKTRIKELLYKKRMTQAEFAERIGVSAQWLSDKINMRGTMTINSSMMIAKALNCHIEDLYEWEEEEV